VVARRRWGAWYNTGLICIVPISDAGREYILRAFTQSITNQHLVPNMQINVALRFDVDATDCLHKLIPSSLLR
jgi:hypothetical protein